jgi:glycosyltransferase involved in cell wall biosynthesis
MSKANTATKILVITSWSFNEPLMHTYVIPNIKIIQDIAGSQTQIFISTFERNRIETLQDEKDIRWIQLSYSNFSFRAIFLYVIQIYRLTRLVTKEKITHLHAFAPVAGTLGLIIKFFTGRKLIIDSWEPHADCMVESKAWKKNSVAYYLLKYSEKLQCKKAEILIATSKNMPEYAFKNLGKAKGRILYRPACVDLNKMQRNEPKRIQLRNENNWNDKLVLVCVSKLGGLYLKEEVFRLFRIGIKHIGEKFQVLLISANAQNEILELMHRFEIPATQLKHIQCSPDQIPNWLSASDIALNPQHPIPSKRYGTPVKDGEYWAMGLPLIILPNISDDSDIVIKENAGVILQSLSDQDMQKCFVEVLDYLKRYPNHHDEIRRVAEKYRSYELAKRAYVEVYGSTPA